MKLIFLTIASLFFIQGCDDTLTVENIDNKIIPSSNVSFADHIYPVMQVKCAFSGCHAQPSPADGIDLSNWSGVTADPNIVFPGEPDLSRLVWSIDRKVGVAEMPPRYSGLFLTQNQIQGIKTWITEGAKNN
jgi:hypothetical protein